MKYEILKDYELRQHCVGEPITLTAVMAILVTAIVAVVVYRLFFSNAGSATIPGGFKFDWK